MFTIRKKLSATEGTDPNTRYDETCECVQSTFDGGETWVDNPAADPRTSPSFLNPGSDDKCSAAQGVANFVEVFLNGAYSAFTIVGIASWAIQVGFFFTPLGIFYRIALLVSDGLLGIGSLTLQETFDSDTFDAIRDIAYCHLNDDGKFDDQAAFDAFGEQLQEDIGGSAFNITMALMFQLYGWVGFSNAALEYAEISDCSGATCAHCHEWLLSEGAVDNLGITFLGGSITANGAESATFFGTSALLTVDFEWDAMVIKDLYFEYHTGAIASFGTRDWQLFDGATVVRSGALDAGAGNFALSTEDVDVQTTRIRIQIHSNGHLEPNWVSTFLLRYSGEQAFNFDNCD